MPVSNTKLKPSYVKGAFLALSFGILLLLLLYFILNPQIGKSTIDIHFYDTYYIISYTSIFVFPVLFLGTLFSIGGVIGSRLKSGPFWLLLVLFLLLDAYYILQLYNSLN